MSYMFQPQSCRFFLYDFFTKIINEQLQDLQFDPIHGVQLSLRSISSDCHQSVAIEIDPDGGISKLSVIEPTTLAAEYIFDFRGDEFINHGESLDLICGHPTFHRLQQTISAHFHAGHYTITVAAL